MTVVPFRSWAFRWPFQLFAYRAAAVASIANEILHIVLSQIPSRIVSKTTYPDIVCAISMFFAVRVPTMHARAAHCVTASGRKAVDTKFIQSRMSWDALNFA